MLSAAVGVVDVTGTPGLTGAPNLDRLGSSSQAMPSRSASRRCGSPGRRKVWASSWYRKSEQFLSPITGVFGIVGLGRDGGVQIASATVTQRCRPGIDAGRIYAVDERT